MATAYYGINSLANDLKYSAIFSPELTRMISEGVRSGGQQFALDNRDQYENSFRATHWRVRDKAMKLADLALDLPGPKRLEEYKINNIYLMAWAHLLFAAGSDKETQEFVEDVASVHVIVSEMAPDNIKWKHTPYVLELDMGNENMYDWIYHTRLVYGSISANKIRAVHTHNVEIAKSHVKQMGLDSRVHQKTGA